MAQQQLMRTSNPALNEKVFQGDHVSFDQAMTLDGTVNKTAVLLACTTATAAWAWHLFSQTHSMASVGPLLVFGAIGGFIVAMVTIFKREWAPS